METNIGEKLIKKFTPNTDFVHQEISSADGGNISLFFLDSMIDKTLVGKNVIEILAKAEKSSTVADVLNQVSVAGAEIKTGANEAIGDVLAGMVVIWRKSFQDKFIALPCQGYKMRAVSEPPTSAVQKGPREGFTEDLVTNLSLIRRRIKHPDLVLEETKIGRYTNTKIVLAYISSIASKQVLDEIKKQLSKIDIDGIIDSFYIEALISPKRSLLFKQVGNTEKPDVAVSKLLEGRVVIIVDGSPIVLTVPYIFLEDMQSGDDYYGQPMHASFIRFLRMLGIIISIMLPGVYVALQSFHYGILPIDFLISIQTSIEGLSYPPLIEILVVLFLFEILNEASIRMPKYSGMALSIVGALVLGDTAVQAGLISPPAVIMVAISGITMFTVPSQIYVASILRFVFTIIGGVTGFYGLLTGFLFLTSYLLTFDAFGASFFAPFAPSIRKDKKDGIFKAGLNNFLTRPDSIPNTNKVRQKYEDIN